MSEIILDGSEIDVLAQQVRRHGVAEEMRIDVLFDSRLFAGPGDCLPDLKDRFFRPLVPENITFFIFIIVGFLIGGKLIQGGEKNRVKRQTLERSPFLKHGNGVVFPINVRPTHHPGLIHPQAQGVQAKEKGSIKRFRGFDDPVDFLGGQHLGNRPGMRQLPDLPGSGTDVPVFCLRRPGQTSGKIGQLLVYRPIRDAFFTAPALIFQDVFGQEMFGNDTANQPLNVPLKYTSDILVCRFRPVQLIPFKIFYGQAADGHAQIGGGTLPAFVLRDHIGIHRPGLFLRCSGRQARPDAGSPPVGIEVDGVSPVFEGEGHQILL